MQRARKMLTVSRQCITIPTFIMMFLPFYQCVNEFVGYNEGYA